MTFQGKKRSSMTRQPGGKQWFDEVRELTLYQCVDRPYSFEVVPQLICETVPAALIPTA